MFSRALGLLLLVLLVATSLTGCKSGYEIVLPPANARFVDQLPSRFLIRYADQQPEQITLNGVRVEQHFTFEHGEAQAPADLLEGYLIQGQNHLAVDSHDLGPRRFFRLDTAGPRVVVTGVTPVDDQVRIQGHLDDPAGAYAVQVNQQPGSLDSEGRFEVTVPVAPFYHFLTEDDYAQRAETTYAHRAHILPDAIKLDITQDALNNVVPFAQSLVEEQNLADLLGVANANTLFRETVNISLPKVVLVPRVCVDVCVPTPFGDACVDECTPEVAIGPYNVNLLSVEASLTTLEFAELNVDQLVFRHQPGDWQGVSLDAELEDVDLGVRLQTDVLGISGAIRDLMDALGIGDLGPLDGDFTANLGLNRLRLAADLGLEAEQGEVDVRVEDVHAVGLGSFDSDFTLNYQLPAPIANFGFGLAGKVVTVIQQGLSAARDLIVDLLLGKLVPLIANLIIDPLINELQVRVGATVSNGALLTALVGVESLAIRDFQGMQLTLNGRIGTETTDQDLGDIDLGVNIGFPDIVYVDDHFLPDYPGIPGNLGPAPGTVPTLLGSRYVATPVPNPEIRDNLSVVLSSNLINQALFAIYEAGVLSPTINIRDDIATTGEYIIVVPEDANTRMVFRPRSVPELSFRGNLISIAYLSLDQFEVEYQRRSVNAQWETALIAVFDAELPVQISNDSEAGLSVALINPLVDIRMDFTEWRELRLQFPSRSLLKRAFAALVLEQVNRGLSALTLPDELKLGGVGTGLSIQPDQFGTVGSPRHHLAFSARLEAL